MSPAFSVGGLGFEPIPGFRTTEGWTFTPYGGWSCYHCGARFDHWLAAERHFGKTPDDIPACISAGLDLVDALRAFLQSEKLFGSIPEPLGLAMRRVDFLRRSRRATPNARADDGRRG
jgi:hypothetical protein